MNVQQGDHVCFFDPSNPDSEYHPISQIKGSLAAVYLGKTHQLVPVNELVEHTKVGSITYFHWTKKAKPAPAPVEQPVDQTWRFDFRVDSWSRIKVMTAANEKAARKKAVDQLARELNRTSRAVNGMLKRPGNSVTAKLVQH